MTREDILEQIKDAVSWSDSVLAESEEAYEAARMAADQALEAMVEAEELHERLSDLLLELDD